MPGGKNWAPMASKPATALANANTLEMAWSGQVSMTGTLPASGGLVVTAALTGEFMAVDANTGCRLTMDLCIALSKMLRRSAALGLALPVMALATLAQASTDPAVGLRRAVEQIGSGRAQFHRSCAQCGGRNRVNAGTTIYDLRKFPVDDAERFKHSVTQGKGNRPSFKQSLAPEQVAVLWAYLGPVAARNHSKADMLRDICAAGSHPWQCAWPTTTHRCRTRSKVNPKASTFEWPAQPTKRLAASWWCCPLTRVLRNKAR